MATDKNFTRIKERVLDYAMSLWEIDDARLIDPVVDLLLDVVAYEFYKLHQEIEKSDAQILNRLARILIPQIWSLPFPAHGLLTVHPLSGDNSAVLGTEDQFYARKVALGKDDTPFYFTPLVEEPLFDIRIPFQAYGTELQYNIRKRTEHIELLPSTHRIADFTLWIGLSIPDSQLGKIATLPICVLPEDRSLLPFIQNVKAYDDQGRELKTAPHLLKQSHEEEHYFEEISTYYQQAYIDLNLPVDPAAKTIKEIFPSALSELDQIEGNENAVWIRLSFPEVFNREELGNIKILFNTFPVVNRQLVLVNHSFRTHGRIVSLPCSHNASLLNIHKFEDNNGCVFRNRLSLYQKEVKGVYSLYFGNLERFDSDNAQSEISKVLRLIREEGNAFASLDTDSLSSDLKVLQEKLDATEKSIDRQNFKGNKNKAFLLTVPHKESHFAELKYWQTQGESANGINQRNLVQQLDMDKFDPSSIRFQTSTVEGRLHTDDQELINSLRYGLLCNNRIVSEEDVKSYIYHRLGSMVNGVDIKDGICISNGSLQGIVRTTDVSIHLSSEIKKVDSKMNQLDFLANTLAEEMQKKSISHSTYKINFI